MPPVVDSSDEEQFTVQCRRGTRSHHYRGRQQHSWQRIVPSKPADFDTRRARAVVLDKKLKAVEKLTSREVFDVLESREPEYPRSPRYFKPPNASPAPYGCCPR